MLAFFYAAEGGGVIASRNYPAVLPALALVASAFI
jgi:hypothetical protein